MTFSHAWRMVPVAALALAIAAPASADVTITSKMTMQAMGQNMASESTIMIKGGSMRTEMSVNGMPQVSIIDVKGRRYITLDPKARTATVTSADAMKDQMEQMGAGDKGNWQDGLSKDLKDIQGSMDILTNAAGEKRLLLPIKGADGKVKNVEIPLKKK